MKKFALIAATLICFAGCARNDDTGTMTDAGSDTSASGSAATGQSGQDSGLNNSGSTTTPSPGLDPTGSPASSDASSAAGSVGSLSNTNTNSLNSLPPQPLPPGAGGQPGESSDQTLQNNSGAQGSGSTGQQGQGNSDAGQQQPQAGNSQPPQ